MYYISQTQERENVFNLDLAYLIGFLPPDLIMGGDFNCVLSSEDCMGEQISSRVLDRVVCRLSLIDTWTHTARKRTSTYYALQSAARLDKIYVLT